MLINLFDDARCFQRTQGFCQWGDGYPGADNIMADIANSWAYAVEAGEEVIGYFFIAFDDAGYCGLNGIWEYDGMFAVVHRLAIAASHRGKGLAKEILRYAEVIAAENGARNMRVDTGEANIIMQRLMLSLGYSPKGLLPFPWGERLAYEKRLR